ncbi:MAG: hydrogenase maturation nickel metallochaperone HypA [Synechococcales cyanobacterium]
MHEVGLMRDILDHALEVARQQGSPAIQTIRLRVGELAGVSPEELHFAFGVVTPGTVAEGSRLEVEWLPVICHCPTCDQDFQPSDASFECPTCHETSVWIRQGRELELSALEVT